LGEQRAYIEEVASGFNAQKVRNELDRSLEMKMQRVKEQLTQDSILYIQRLLTEKFTQEPTPQFNSESGLGSAHLDNLRLEIERMKEFQRSIESKVEEYKDDFVNRLSLYRSFDDNLTSSTAASLGGKNPLASQSLSADREALIFVPDGRRNLNINA
jgi:hypothetical protein